MQLQQELEQKIRPRKLKSLKSTQFSFLMRKFQKKTEQSPLLLQLSGASLSPEKQVIPKVRSVGKGLCVVNENGQESETNSQRKQHVMRSYPSWISKEENESQLVSDHTNSSFFDSYFDEHKHESYEDREDLYGNQNNKDIDSNDKQIPSINIESIDTSEKEIQQMVRFSKNLQKSTEEELRSREVFLGEQISSKTIIFDLDETLVSAKALIILKQNDQAVSIDTRSDSCSSEDLQSFNVTIEYDEQFLLNIRVILRPFITEVLQYLSQNYEVGIFTASEEKYANAVREIIDPKNEYISFLLSRNHCIMRDNIYIKDLSIIKDRDLKDIVIIDNSITSFAFQLSNGIPISAFNGTSEEANDQELLFVVQYLQEALAHDDIREYNQSVLSLDPFAE